MTLDPKAGTTEPVETGKPTGSVPPGAADRNTETTEQELARLRAAHAQSLAEKTTLENLRRENEEYRARSQNAPTIEPRRSDVDQRAEALRENHRRLQKAAQDPDEAISSIAQAILLRDGVYSESINDVGRRADLAGVDASDREEIDKLEREFGSLSAAQKYHKTQKEAEQLRRENETLKARGGGPDPAATVVDTTVRGLGPVETKKRELTVAQYTANLRDESIPREERIKLRRDVESGARPLIHPA